MLSLTSRTARLNQDYKGKSKEKDGEVTKLLTFGIDECEIDEKELGAITGEPHAARALINSTRDGKRPMFECFKPFQLIEDVENAAVTVTLRGGSEHKFTGCKITKIRFIVNASGAIVMSYKVLAAPALDARYAEFIANSGEMVDVETHGTQPSDQKSLALNTHGADEPPPAELTNEEKPKRGRQRKGEARVN